MAKMRKTNSNFSLRMLLLLGSVFSCLNLVVAGDAAAGEAGVETQHSSNGVVAQSTPTTQTPPAPRRPRPSFFEQERRFGFGDFLDSALDGGGRVFSSDPITDLSSNNFDLNPLARGSAPVTGSLSVENRSETNPNFLRTDFSSPGANLTFSNAQPSSDPRTGTITLNGTVTINGTTIPFRNVPATYTGSFSAKDNNVSGAIQVINPNDPNTSIFIQLPPTRLPNINNPNEPLRAPAQLSIGRPTDR